MPRIRFPSNSRHEIAYVPARQSRRWPRTAGGGRGIAPAASPARTDASSSTPTATPAPTHTRAHGRKVVWLQGGAQECVALDPSSCLFIIIMARTILAATKSRQPTGGYDVPGSARGCWSVSGGRGGRRARRTRRCGTARRRGSRAARAAAGSPTLHARDDQLFRGAMISLQRRCGTQKDSQETACVAASKRLFSAESVAGGYRRGRCGCSRGT